jgi:hypothetical protein
MEEIIRVSEILSSVKWYFELKNLSLNNALSLRCPLSVEEQKNSRQYYSQYFLGLLSATEMLLEKEYKNHEAFKMALEKGFVFDNYTDGEGNYSYLKELRNSVIHRGLNIDSAAHIYSNFPLLIAPSPVTNRSGKNSYIAFGYYLIEIINRCESIIGNIFLDHFQEFGLFNIRLSKKEAEALMRKHILESIAMPEWAKKMALESNIDIDHEVVHQNSIDNMVNILKTDVLSKHFDLIPILLLVQGLEH